ncbi:transcriptional regulator, AraC family [Sphingobacterium spiritivorum ATCC 33300]|uniref:Transcriptional regulator, AraC family n=1 Tax=Sphingobacterium spiritivorum ATCC 33300 TaxID=525372 RepID=C2G4W3_SPHSI|nr:AraC family transcriptional regulator [Sphingobacterium spiritivorum]EEI89714.1 transcriptional regulator, AraC family [Sphingobacterium spiritivorum ATCC 33300]QQS94755.1 helix-turn-helix transcriptional regulator [Sphingobacterium spiritivorum]
MALFITLDNVYELYNLDPSKKTEGIIVLSQRNDPKKKYTAHSRLFDGLLLGFMIKGSMKSQIHFLEYEINAGDIAILQPQLMIDTKLLSEDAEIVTIGLSLDFITEFPILREFVMNNQIRWHPIIRLQPEDIKLQNELLTLIQNFYHKNPSANKSQMLQHLVMVLISMISEVYSNSPKNKSLVKNRTHEIIDNFYLLISKHANQQRSVAFYAEKLHLTPQYLSTFLKQKTGKSVLQWIDHITILHAKTLLKSSNLSIKEICNELHFEETSVFSRYFKRIAGVSPKTYRNE